MKIFSLTLIVILLFYLGIALFLYLKQRAFLYYPTPKIESAYPTFFLSNGEAKINIVVLNEGKKNAILYFGGNAESIAESSDYIAGQFPDFTVYLMEYRSYGFSTGEPSEKALYSDALKLYDTISGEHEHISVGGRSLGTALAIYVAAKREVSKLALITPFDSIVNVAQERYPIYPVKWLMKDHYNSVSRVGKITCDTFIVIAQNDSVIPRDRTEKLIEAFPKEQLSVDIIENRGHADISSDPRYYRIMQDFIGDG